MATETNNIYAFKNKTSFHIQVFNHFLSSLSIYYARAVQRNYNIRLLTENIKHNPIKFLFNVLTGFLTLLLLYVLKLCI